jgi:D-amino-acid dehydrogenase
VAVGTRHVTIVGVGIIGLSCARYLQRDGHQVTVLDGVGPGEGASKSNAGYISSSACIPVSTPGIVRRVPPMLVDPLAPLAIRWTYLPWLAPWLLRFVRAGSPDRVEAISVALAHLLRLVHASYRDLTEGSEAAVLLRPGGVLYTYETDESFAGAQWGLDLRCCRGIDFTVLHGDEVRQCEPAVSPSVQHGVLYPHTMFCVDPHALVRAFADDVSRARGEIVRATVLDIEMRPQGPRAVRTLAGRRSVDVLVIAAGAWSKRLVARVGHRVPLDTERGYVADLPRMAPMPQIAVLSGDHSVATTPMASGLRLSGTVELAGLRGRPNFAPGAQPRHCRATRVRRSQRQWGGLLDGIPSVDP